MPDNHIALILGAKGFIGSHLTEFLLGKGLRVRAFDRQWDRPSARQKQQIGAGLLELIAGSVLDEKALGTALEGVSQVFNCVSFSVPATSPGTLTDELNTTVPAMSLLLSAMAGKNVPSLFYFSSGGTVYGDTGMNSAKETDPLIPCCSYAMGKVICEEMIRFYGRVHGLQYHILRVSNIYGAVDVRHRSQGVVDVFVDRVMRNEPLTVWGSPDHLRDYIFIDDVVQVIGLLLDRNDSKSWILNVGSGKGSSIRDIIDVIERLRQCSLEWHTDTTRYAGVSHSVLDTSLLKKWTGWNPAYSLEQGIAELFRRKMK